MIRFFRLVVVAALFSAAGALLADDPDARAATATPPDASAGLSPAQLWLWQPVRQRIAAAD